VHTTATATDHCDGRGKTKTTALLSSYRLRTAAGPAGDTPWDNQLANAPNSKQRKLVSLEEVRLSHAKSLKTAKSAKSA
jgi:hypothetical protein